VQLRFSVKLNAMLFALVSLFAISPLSASAADDQPPQVVSSSITPRTVAYNGNATAGFTTVDIKTNEPTRGSISVIGNSRSTKINLSTTDFRTEHVINWAPWDDSKKEPLPPGQYTLKLNLQDQALNESQGYPLGTITVVAEPNPLKLIDTIVSKQSVISPHYDDVNPSVLYSYRLNRHAEVQLVVRDHNGAELYHGTKEKLAPGTYTTPWFGKNDAGNVVPDGSYDIILKTIELDYNYPDATPTEYKLGTITVKDGVNALTQNRLKAIVTDAHFDASEFTPNGDGVDDKVGGSITLAEPAKVTVWISNKINKHVQSVIAYQDLQPGTYPFAWDGKEAWGGTMPNGTYSLQVSVQKDGDIGDLYFEQSQVTLKGSIDIQVPAQALRVRVIQPESLMTVTPLSQGYTAKQGDIFTFLNLDNGKYHVLLTDNIEGWIKPEDVEFLDLDSIPLQWGWAAKDGVAARVGPGSNYDVVENVTQGTKIRILRQDLDWYRVLLASGRQAFIAVSDLPQSAPAPAQTQSITYTVAAGDTLWKISQKYGVTIQAIVDANKLDPSHYLTIGQQLVIPGQQPQSTQTSLTYVVQSGDTLWKISQKYGVTIQAIVDANKLDPSQYLTIGQQLVIPGQQPQPTQTSLTYVVQSGDTLWKISQKYGVTIQAIIDANKLDPSQYLYIGQQLVIPGQQPQPTQTSLTYVVQSGDTLWKISQKLGVGLDALMAANPQVKPENIYEGMVLNTPQKTA
jgi:LysM repeat protein/flagellar hook assembly protein FlgD